MNFNYSKMREKRYKASNSFVYLKAAQYSSEPIVLVEDEEISTLDWIIGLELLEFCEHTSCKNLRNIPDLLYRYLCEKCAKTFLEAYLN